MNFEFMIFKKKYFLHCKNIFKNLLENNAYNTLYLSYVKLS